MKEKLKSIKKIGNENVKVIEGGMSIFTNEVQNVTIDIDRLTVTMNIDENIIKNLSDFIDKLIDIGYNKNDIEFLLKKYQTKTTQDKQKKK